MDQLADLFLGADRVLSQTDRARQQEALDDDAALATELADDAPTTPGGPLDALADAELDLEFERLVHSASKW